MRDTITNDSAIWLICQTYGRLNLSNMIVDWVNREHGCCSGCTETAYDYIVNVSVKKITVINVKKCSCVKNA